MKRVCAVSFALLLSAGTLTAQQRTTNKQEHPRCPIAMRAQHLADGEMVQTGAAHPRGIGQWLRLTLTGLDSRRIAEATLTILGMSPKSRAMEALQNRSNSSDAEREQVVHFTAQPDGHDSANLWVPGITAVQSIEVSSLTYADGATWKYAEDAVCRVTPEGFMPVDGR